MGDQHPLDPFAEFEGILDALRRDAALRLPWVGSEELANLRRSTSEALMAVEREALMTFARANGIGEERLWTGVSEISHRGRVTAANFVWCEVTAPSALASCTKIEYLALGGNKIADISALESCAQLCMVELTGNPLSKKSLQVIGKLRDRRVRVYC